MRGIIIGLGLAQGGEGSVAPVIPYSNTKSIIFDGVDEYLDCGTPASFGGLDQQFSAACWFNTEINSACDLFGKWETANHDWLIFMTTGLIVAAMNTSTGAVGVNTAAAYNDGGWHLAIITWDGVDLVVDVDGGADRVSAGAADRIGGVGSKAFIAARDDGLGGATSIYFGNIDEVTFFDAALSAGQCVELYNSGIPMDVSAHTAASDLVSWYRMGDASGDSTDSGDPASRVKDVTGSNNATPVNMDLTDIVTVVPPTFNRLSLLTDGVDEYAWLTGASVTGCDPDWDTPFSVSVWFNTTAGGPLMNTLASKLRGAPTYRGWTVGVFDGKPFFGLYNDAATLTYIQAYVDQYVATGAWKHLVFTYDGSGLASGVTFYLNGSDAYPQGQVAQAYHDALAGNTSLGGASAPLSLCSQASVGQFLGGSIDEVSIWSKELSGADVSTIYNNGTPKSLTGMTDLDAYYRCGEAPGDSATGTIFDLSGNSNDLAGANMEAADIQAVTPRPFWNLLSASFDGVDERLYSSPAGNAPTYDTFDPFSASVWFKTTTATYGSFVAKELTHPSYIGWCLFIHTNNALRVEISGGGAAYIDVITNTTGWNDGNWHHVLFCWDGSGGAAGVSLYIDGALQATTILSDTLGGGSILTSDPFTIGCRGGTTLGAWIPYDGRIDEVSLYSATLSPANAVEIYNNGRPRDVMTLTTAVDLDAYYRCGDKGFDAIVAGQAAVYDATANNYDLVQANMEQADFGLDTP
jgi:hypothetical protein